jgi:hypothetical protein
MKNTIIKSIPDKQSLPELCLELSFGSKFYLSKGSYIFQKSSRQQNIAIE